VGCFEQTHGGENPTPGARTITHGVLGEILSLAFWMQKQGYRPSTIRSCVNTLKTIAKKAGLLEPESVKSCLVSASVSVGRKEKICQDLARLYKLKKIPFQMPRYRRVDSLPFVPQESEIDQLISASGNKTTVFLQLVELRYEYVCDVESYKVFRKRKWQPGQF
jgi:hypothetical protein